MISKLTVRLRFDLERCHHVMLDFCRREFVNSRRKYDCTVLRNCNANYPALVGFYRAMLYIRGTSHGTVSVRPSVCHKSVFY